MKRHNITFISTTHKNNGKCNADELHKILEKKCPDVIFLEALNNTYSNYQKINYENFGVYHQKLELESIQKYSINHLFEYVPVLKCDMLDVFDHKYQYIYTNHQFQKMLDEFNSLVKTKGFKFLNGQICMEWHKKMRIFENHILNNNELIKAVDAAIDNYENSMMQSIYSYCENNQFNKAVFLCGSAHKYSIIEKIQSLYSKEKVSINWTFYGE